MDNSGAGLRTIETNGLRIGELRGWRVASLRYFDRDGVFGAAVCQCIGCAVPQPLQALRFRPPLHDAEVVLAWRSPSETLFVCNDGAFFARAERHLAAAGDGCMVDQTGGISILEVRGRRAVDLMQRMGAWTGIPGSDEARGTRMADVHVLTVCIRPGEYLLMVERVYADHLLEWSRVTATDMS